MNEYQLLMNVYQMRMIQMPLTEFTEWLRPFGHTELSAIEWAINHLYVINGMVYGKWNIWRLDLTEIGIANSDENILDQIRDRSKRMLNETQ